jgi:cytochrome c-type protein NapC
MAVSEWTRMKKNNSQECRNCHDLAKADPEKQSEKARERHAKVIAERTDCIDCHFGIAHTEPDGPGPKELKIAR